MKYVYPINDIDFIIYANDDKTTKALESFAYTHCLPVKRIEPFSNDEAADLLSGVLSSVLLLTSEEELPEFQKMAEAFTQQGVEVCLRTL